MKNILENKQINKSYSRIILILTITILILSTVLGMGGLYLFMTILFA